MVHILKEWYFPIFFFKNNIYILIYLTNFFSWSNVFYDYNIYAYNRVYLILSLVFRFFKKKIGYPLNTVKNFGYFLVQIDGAVYAFPIKIFDYGFVTMRFSSIFWLFFLFVYVVLLEKNDDNLCVDSRKFWNFSIYIIVKGFILCGFKSALVVHGFWPRYLYTPEKLFAVITSDIKFYKNPSFIMNKELKKNTKKYIFSNILKKKKKFFLNTFFFFKNVVYFSVSNLIKLFTFLNRKLYTVLFIRKQKFFNKGRYSRNRQLYRTGVYWCMYVNILAVFGLNYLFYKFTVNFLQYWWFFFVILSSFIFSYFFKSSLYSYLKNLFFFKEYCTYTGYSFNYNFFLNGFYKLLEDFNNFLENLLNDFY